MIFENQGYETYKNEYGITNSAMSQFLTCAFSQEIFERYLSIFTSLTFEKYLIYLRICSWRNVLHTTIHGNQLLSYKNETMTTFTLWDK